jgi:lipoprotein-anchoring transpeptidase ErfK/SrfK
MDIQLEDLDRHSYPRRRPVLIIAGLVVIAIVLFVIIRARVKGGGGDAGEIPSRLETPVTVVQPTTGDPVRAGGGEATPVVTDPDDDPVEVVGDPIDPDTGRSLLRKARDQEAKEEFLDARMTCLELLRQNPTGKLRDDVEKLAGRVNMELLFNPHRMPEKAEYEVRKNDSLGGIAQKFGTTVELIQKSNGIENPHLIKRGDDLRVLKAEVSIAVDLSSCRLVLYLNGEFCKRYPVGVGAYDRTPTGSYIITYKEPFPKWFRRGGEAIEYGEEGNILGTRWMATKDADNPGGDGRGIGIHGTTDDTSVGKSVSAGCVRMYNEDVEELYAIVPIGTPVEIVE